MEEGSGPHPDIQDGQGKQDAGQEEEEEVDIMNSPVQQPWGAEVCTFFFFFGSAACLLLHAHIQVFGLLRLCLSADKGFIHSLLFACCTHLVQKHTTSNCRSKSVYCALAIMYLTNLGWDLILTSKP